jgi:hypothetical protein
MVLFYNSSVQVRKYAWLVLSDRDNIPCSWVYVDGVLNESENRFQCLGVVYSFWGTGSVPMLLHVVCTYERVIPYLHTNKVV